MTVKQFWRLWAALLFVELLLVLNINVDIPRKSREQAVRSEPWAGSFKLTADADMDSAQAELMTTTMWGRMASSSAAAAAGVEPPPPVWSLSGVFIVDNKRYVILSFEGEVQPTQQLTTGDLLPNGEKIKEIERDKVLVQTAAKGKQHWIQINRTADSSK